MMIRKRNVNFLSLSLSSYCLVNYKCSQVFQNEMSDVVNYNGGGLLPLTYSEGRSVISDPITEELSRDL